MNTDSTKSNKYHFFLHHFHIMAKVKAFPDPQISFLCILDRLGDVRLVQQKTDPG